MNYVAGVHQREAGTEQGKCVYPCSLLVHLAGAFEMFIP